MPYACPQSPGDTFVFDGAEQRAFGAEIDAVTLRSLHADVNLMDASTLFRLSVAAG